MLSLPILNNYFHLLLQCSAVLGFGGSSLYYSHYAPAFPPPQFLFLRPLQLCAAKYPIAPAQETIPNAYLEITHHWVSASCEPREWWYWKLQPGRSNFNSQYMALVVQRCLLNILWQIIMPYELLRYFLTKMCYLENPFLLNTTLSCWLKHLLPEMIKLYLTSGAEVPVYSVSPSWDHLN